MFYAINVLLIDYKQYYLFNFIIKNKKILYIEKNKTSEY